mgnify:CR=1 FL=1
MEMPSSEVVSNVILKGYWPFLIKIEDGEHYTVAAMTNHRQVVGVTIKQIKIFCSDLFLRVPWD